MKSLYDQLLALQQIPNTYDELAAYRAELTAFIVAHTDHDTSALIVGAGACNDFDLPKLIEHFSQITLLDRNVTSVHAGMHNQGVAAERIHVVQADLLGISDAAYRAMDAVLLEEIRNQMQQKAGMPECFEQLFLSQMLEAFKRRKPHDFVASGINADYVICCGVHSQLLNLFPQMAGVYQRYIQFNSERIYAEVREMNRIVVEELNAQLLRLAKKGVILGLEESRIGMAGGIEGAAQALESMQLHSADLIARTRLIWPFDAAQGKTYYVLVGLLE